MRGTCDECGVEFSRTHGRQRYCETCQWPSCGTCGNRYRRARRGSRFCSLKCVGAYPGNVERLQTVRGVKPRTYHLRERTRWGNAADRDWRTAVFERDDYTCQSCGERGGRLQAHHIKPYREVPELRHELSNGQTLCVQCHQKTETYGWSKYWHRRRREIAAKRLAQAVLPGMGVA